MIHILLIGLSVLAGLGLVFCLLVALAIRARIAGLIKPRLSCGKCHVAILGNDSRFFCTKCLKLYCGACGNGHFSSCNVWQVLK
jgi:hypothetical protein